MDTFHLPDFVLYEPIYFSPFVVLSRFYRKRWLLSKFTNATNHNSLHLCNGPDLQLSNSKILMILYFLKNCSQHIIFSCIHQSFWLSKLIYKTDWIIILNWYTTLVVLDIFIVQGLKFISFHVVGYTQFLFHY